MSRAVPEPEAYPCPAVALALHLSGGLRLPGAGGRGLPSPAFCMRRGGQA